MSDRLIFHCEGQDHHIALVDDPASETLAQLRAWLPAEVTIHCAKIAGCHIYWPSPVLARLEKGQDIHTLAPGAFLYYPGRQYMEIIYDALQAETAEVTLLGHLEGDIGWLRDYATRQRREAGFRPFTARLSIEGDARPKPVPAFPGDTAWDRIRRARRAVWAAEPDEIAALIGNSGHNIPFGPMMTADGYFRAVFESLWQLWVAPDRFDDRQRRAAAINALELGIARIGHYCRMGSTQALLADGIACIEDGSVPLQELLAELILYCSRMSNWIDLHIPWFEANELTRRALGRAEGGPP